MKENRFESERLILRPFEESDTLLCTWFRDDEVMQWIPGGPDRDVSATSSRIAKYMDHYERYGFSKYVVMERSSGAAIGDCGLMHLEDTDMLELGYRIASVSQRKGYATEAAKAVLWQAAHRGIAEVNAIVEPENDRSVNILEQKLGFVLEGQYTFLGIPMRLYTKSLKSDQGSFLLS